MGDMRIYWLLAALVLSALLSALNWWASVDFLYWRYEWFDLPMHFLGGLALGVFIIVLLGTFRPRLFLIGITAVAIGWEIFEYVFGLPREANYVLDTKIDLLMDALGATVAYSIARLTLWRMK
jgi:hypothetical protein